MPEEQEENKPVQHKEEKVLFSWKAPARPFKKRDKEFFTTVAAIGFLIGLILFFIEGYLPVAVTVALVFLVYVLATVPPEEVVHKISTKGIYFAGKFIPWFGINRFWFTNRFGSELLVLETMSFTGRLEFVIHTDDQKTIKRHLFDYVLFEEIAPNFLDKAATWLGKRVKLNTD